MFNLTTQHGLEITLFLLLSFCLIWFQFKPTYRSLLVTVFSTAFILRVVFSLFLVLGVLDYQSIFLLQDDMFYDQVSREIAASGRGTSRSLTAMCTLPSGVLMAS